MLISRVRLKSLLWTSLGSKSEYIVFSSTLRTLMFRRAGIDGGGVFKEFLTSLCKEVFDTDHGLWLATKKNELYPNPHAYATERK
jgi:hypothetical protein